jgi:probable addiction module antidote protein
MTKRKFRTLDTVEAEYFRKHPDEIDAYISDIFEDYAQTRQAPALLASLRVIAKVKGISDIAAHIGVTRQGLQKALSPKGNPRFENINAIMNAFGYQLMPKKIDRDVA